MNDTPTHTTNMPSETAMRRALAQRDANYDGAFLYGAVLPRSGRRGIRACGSASTSALIAQLKSEFPNATHTPSSMTDSPELDAWMQALDAHIVGRAPRPDLPLDLRGTAFQIRVWRFLLRIPEGSVVSYSELADGIGAPQAVRRRPRPAPPTALPCWCPVIEYCAATARSVATAGASSASGC